MIRNTFVLRMKRILRRGLYIASGLLVFAGSYDFLLQTAPWAPWAAGIGLILGYIALFVGAKGNSKDHQGARVATAEEATAALSQGRPNRKGSSIRLGSISPGHKGKRSSEDLPLSYGGGRHLITFGEPGSGIGSRVILPNLHSTPRSCVVIDPNGQYAAESVKEREKLGNQVFILNPFNLRPERLQYQGKQVANCARYNPLDHLDPYSANFVGDVASLAEALIVHQGGDPHWTNAARELVAALIMHVCLTRGRESRNLGQVRVLLTQPLDPPYTDDKQEGLFDALLAMKNSSFPPLAQKATHFLEATGETMSVISTARLQLAFLDDPAVSDALSGSDFRFADLRRIPTTVFLVLPARQLAAQTRWLRVLITSAIKELSDVQKFDGRRVLFMLDEFARLGRLEAIERAMALLENGVQLWPFLYGLPQFQSSYPECWESLLAAAGVVQFVSLNDSTTAEYVSNRCGVRLAERKTDSAKQWELYGAKFGNHQQMLFVEGLPPVVLCQQERSFLQEAPDPDSDTVDDLITSPPAVTAPRQWRRDTRTAA